MSESKPVPFLSRNAYWQTRQKSCISHSLLNVNAEAKTKHGNTDSMFLEKESGDKFYGC
jgi:hypothetical protein